MTSSSDVVLIGGVDPRGGAGLLRDVLTATALGARSRVVGTAWTEQQAGVHRVEPRNAESILDSVRHALAARPAAVKIGMVPNGACAEAIVVGLGSYDGPVVVDPVLASSRGGRLFDGDPAELFPLLRRATLATPNAAEAAALSGLAVRDLDGAAAAARALHARGVTAVLVKGGHLATGATVTDTLFSSAALDQRARARVGGGDARGTGCALATALALHLGRGATLEGALAAATAWLARALAAAVDVGDERHLG